MQNKNNNIPNAAQIPNAETGVITDVAVAKNAKKVVACVTNIA